MNYWLVKTEPLSYSWENLVIEKKGVWDGVRNFQACGNMKKMKKGDLVFIYHTGKERAIVGIARVIEEAYPDPKDKNWVAINLAPFKPLKIKISLERIKSEKNLKEISLVKLNRLSVQPVLKHEFDYILKMSNGE